MNITELKKLFEICQKLEILTVGDLWQFGGENDATSNKILLNKLKEQAAFLTA